HAQRLWEEAAHLRDDARERFRSVFEQATSETGASGAPGAPGATGGHGPEPGQEAGPGDREHRQHRGHGGRDWGARGDWGDWGSWFDWGRWGDRPGRKGWAGPREAAAFRDLERLAREFATDLRNVAWDSGAFGGEVIVTLRDILEDTLNRIRTDVFGGHEEPGSAAPGGSAGDAPGGTEDAASPAPGDATEKASPAEPSASSGTSAPAATNTPDQGCQH